MGDPTVDWLPRHKLSVADYHRLGAAGVLGEDDRVELIEGELIDMAPIGSRHASTVAQLARRFVQTVGEAAIVYIQNPVLLPGDSEPQPDVALLKPRADFYAASHPGPDDILLIIEVADTSVRYDREIKLPLYARHGISEVWLIDLESRRIEAFCKPSEGMFTQSRLIDPTGRRAPIALPELEVDLAGLF